MDQDQLDNLFKESLENHKTPLDKDALWVAIKGSENRKYGKGYIVPLLSLAALCLISFSIFSAAETSDIHPTSADTSSILEATLPAPVAMDNKIISSPETGISTASLTLSKNEGQATTTSLTRPTEKNLDAEPTASKDSQSLTSPHSLPITPTRYQRDTDTPPANNSTPNDNLRTAQSNARADINRQFITAAGRITPATTILGTPLSNPQLSMQLADISETDCYDYKNNQHRLSADAYFLIDYTDMQFSTTEENLDYLQRREDSQTQLEAYRSGLRLKYRFDNGFYVKAGVETGLIKERFNEEISEERTEILPNQLLEVITRMDTTIYIYGDAPVTSIHNTVWRVTNIYKTVGIPVLLGYERKNGNITYGIELGAVQNLLFDFDGHLVIPDGTPTDDPDFFKTNIRTSFTGALNVGYTLNERYNLFLTTNFKQNLSFINNANNDINQKNMNIGLGVGVEWLLF